jgi:hypothetical protein
MQTVEPWYYETLQNCKKMLIITDNHTTWKLLKYITRITVTKRHQGLNDNMGIAIFFSLKLLSQEYENNEEF